MEFVKSFSKSQVFKFLLVGLFCASIEFLTFNILIDKFEIKYLIANVVSIVLAISINYALSRSFVFQKSRYSKGNEFLSFVLFSVLAILLNQSTIWFFVEIVKFDVRLCKAIAIVIVAFFNYLTKKHIVFKV